MLHIGGEGDIKPPMFSPDYEVCRGHTIEPENVFLIQNFEFECYHLFDCFIPCRGIGGRSMDSDRTKRLHKDFMKHMANTKMPNTKLWQISSTLMYDLGVNVDIPDPGVNINIPDTSTDYNHSQKIAFILPGQQINVWRGRGVKPISSRIISDSGVT